jgi:hypothetical protein
MLLVIHFQKHASECTSSFEQRLHVMLHRMGVAKTPPADTNNSQVCVCVCDIDGCGPPFLFSSSLFPLLMLLQHLCDIHVMCNGSEYLSIVPNPETVILQLIHCSALLVQVGAHGRITHEEHSLISSFRTKKRSWGKPTPKVSHSAHLSCVSGTPCVTHHTVCTNPLLLTGAWQHLTFAVDV